MAITSSEADPLAWAMVSTLTATSLTLVDTVCQSGKDTRRALFAIRKKLVTIDRKGQLLNLQFA
eukprot:CAMPEP_0114229438 /NCGR_PEP_ID=MMETSP0058-20121206/2904_1 /TAXON_ID=36894 /ORGANISM="Pyramimonas parkeae, CCMP726" /LENGTH=63 /DNA_ID=CAMNT_0001340507 /DNA_START=819 /DNA_END=1010 /DNA_ORIENTATION=+